MAHHVDLELGCFAELHHGVFPHAIARRCGVTRAGIRHRVDSGRWVAVHDRVYRVAGAPVSWRGRLLAACWAGGLRAVASHRAAAALYGLPGGRRRPPEITGPRWRRSRHTGVLAHESKALPGCDTTVADGIPVTTPARTLIDLGAVVGPTVLELALDEALRRELVTVRDTRRRLEQLARPGRGGIRVLRRLLRARTERAAVSESVAETRLSQLLRERGLPVPVLQYEVRAGSERLARVDAAYPDVRVAIEYDSYLHHGGRARHELDVARRNRLRAAGWQVVSVTKADLDHRLREVAPAIRSALRHAS